MFENVNEEGCYLHNTSKSEYKISDKNDYSVAKTYCEENAEFIAFCFNLQQRLDISCYEEVVKALESLKNSIQSHPDFISGEDDDEWHTLTGITEQILNKAKK